MRSKPTLATSWRRDFTVDVPREVFDLIYQKIPTFLINRGKNQPVRTLKSRTGEGLAVFVFNKMNDDRVLVSHENLLKKCLGNCAGDVHAVERWEKPMRLKYHHNTEVLSVKFHYGHWNQFGVPQY